MLAWVRQVLLQCSYISLPNCFCPFFQHVQITLVYAFVCSFLSLPTPGNLHHIHPAIIMSFLSSFLLFFYLQGLTTIENNTMIMSFLSTLLIHASSWKKSVLAHFLGDFLSRMTSSFPPRMTSSFPPRMTSSDNDDDGPTFLSRMMRIIK